LWKESIPDVRSTKLEIPKSIVSDKNCDSTPPNVPFNTTPEFRRSVPTTEEDRKSGAVHRFLSDSTTVSDEKKLSLERYATDAVKKSLAVNLCESENPTELENDCERVKPGVAEKDGDSESSSDKGLSDELFKGGESTKTADADRA
jgi:hypothetical protein